MPLLSALLVQCFTGLSVWLASYMTKKVAIGLAAALTISTIIGVLLGAMRLAINGILIAVPSNGFVLMGLTMAFPPFASTVVSTVATVWAACVLYGWQKTALAALQRG